MARLTWEPTAARLTEGVEMGVLYLSGQAVPWNGLVSVEEADSSDTDVELYFEGKRHRLATDLGVFSANVAAYTYPEEFSEYDGLDDYADNQNRKRFGFSWRNAYAGGYQIHLVYNAQMFPSPNSHSSHNETADISPFKWALVTSAIELTWTKASNHLVVNSVDAHPVPLQELENMIYGTDSSEPYLPSPAQVIDMFEDYTTSRITYNGDGTFTATGPDNQVQAPDAEGIFTIDLPTAFYVLDDGTYLMRSHWEGG